MTGRITSPDTVSAIAEAHLEASFGHRGDVPDACCNPLIRWLNLLRRSDDPVVTFASLARACVPDFADGCGVELSDGTEPPFRVTHRASAAADYEPATAPAVIPDRMLLTPFRVVSRTGYPSYAGLVTHWWDCRAPSPSDAAVADMIVKHVVALVDRERLIAAVARAEDRAASLALEAVCGRTTNLATGIVMHQNRLTADEAEKLLRQSARIAGTDLAQLAAGVVHSGALAHSAAAGCGPGLAVPDLVLPHPGISDAGTTRASFTSH
jgi:hypothetical protein